MRRYHGTVCAAVAAVIALLAGARAIPASAADAKEEMVPLPLRLPRPVFPGTPKDIPMGANVEPPSDKPRPIPMVPKGTKNVALGKKVTSSSKGTFTGSLDQMTDGEKEAREDAAVELKPRLQWAQIDLGAEHSLSYILIWHFHGEPIICHDVVVQVSNDADFIEGVTTLFNNDADNSAGLGIGKDFEYWETFEGKQIDAKGAKARYVRLYSRGSTYRDPLNRYTEVEVYGLAR